MTETELQKRGIEEPSGKAGIKKAGTSFYLEWTGSNRDVQLQPTEDPTKAKLKIKETGFHRYFVQLHKAKGGLVFKIYAAIWGLALVVLILTGMWMAWKRGHRNTAIISLILGLVVFFLAAWTS